MQETYPWIHGAKSDAQGYKGNTIKLSSDYVVGDYRVFQYIKNTFKNFLDFRIVVLGDKLTEYEKIKFIERILVSGHTFIYNQ